MSAVRVTIEKLALKGFAPDQREALAEALQSELARTLSDPAARAAWTRPQHVPVMRLPGMALGPGPSGSRKLGGEVGRAVGRGLKR